MRRWTIWLLLILPIPCWADATAAFNDGKNLGNAVNPQNLGAISAGSIQDKLPAYGQSVAETGYFQGGHGDTVGPGAGKVSLCATATPDSDPIRRQECDAVNFLARNPDIRPQFTITSNDPMILGARTARNSAEAVFQSSGISGGMGSNSQCVTRTETSPAQTTTETCSSIRELTTEQCTMGRIINIDSDANYQCDETVNAYEIFTCKRSFSFTTKVIQVTAWNCPRTWNGVQETCDNDGYNPVVYDVTVDCPDANGAIAITAKRYISSTYSPYVKCSIPYQYFDTFYGGAPCVDVEGIPIEGCSVVECGKPEITSYTIPVGGIKYFPNWTLNPRAANGGSYATWPAYFKNEGNGYISYHFVDLCGGNEGYWHHTALNNHQLTTRVENNTVLDGIAFHNECATLEARSQ